MDIQILSHNTPRSLWQLWHHQRFFRLRQCIFGTQATVTHDFLDLLHQPWPEQSISGPSKTRLFSLVTCMNVLHDFFAKDGRYNYSITFVQHAVVNANLLSVGPVFRNIALSQANLLGLLTEDIVVAGLTLLDVVCSPNHPSTLSETLQH